MDFISDLREKAKLKKGIVVLPEAHMDKRVYDAGKYLIENKLSRIIVFGNKADYELCFLDENWCKIVDIQENSQLFANQLYEMRKAKGLTQIQATELVKQPIYYAMMLLKNNMADGVVAGASYTTADVLRPAFQIIKTKPNKSLVTGSMIMLKEGKQPMLFGDISLINKPNSEQLKEIALSNAEFMKNMLKIEPKVAMLSYSTHGSAKSDEISIVQNAMELLKDAEYLIDGEMQADTALDQATAIKKGITSKVGGNANVLIFPNLDAGNIAYKLVQILGGYETIGPFMINLNKPVNDLSRGCNCETIINTVCLTKLQME